MVEPKLSILAQTLIGSEIVKLGGIIKDKISKGEHIYNYTIGDFDSSEFPIPELLRNEIKKAYDEGYTTYPLADGETDLRKAVAAFIKSRQELEFDISEILIAAGGRPLIYAAFRAIVDKGDKVIYPIPSWNNNHYTHFTEGEHVKIEALEENNFMPTADQIRPHIKGAAMIALCSPLNPTGTVFKKQDLQDICDLIIEENSHRKEEDKKLYLLYDQIYWTLTFGDTEHFNPISLRPKMKEYTVFVDGISKAFAATGVRVGWSFGPKHLIAKMKAINSHVGAWAPMAEQKAVAKFLVQEEVVDDYFIKFKKEIDFRLKKIYEGFIALKNEGFSVDAIYPQAAIYLTVKIDLVGKSFKEVLFKTQPEVTEYILNEAKLAMVPFSSFGAKADSCWYRISVGCVKKEEISDVLNKLRRTLKNVE